MYYDNFIFGNKFLQAHFQNQKSDDPDFVHPDYVKHYDKFSLTEAFELGLDGIKDRLVKYPNESQDNYNSRQDTLTLKNYVTRLANGVTGMIMRKPTQILNEPPFLSRILPELDRLRNYDEVIKDIIYRVTRDGKCFLLTDAPKQEEEGMPYLKLLNRSQVINWRYSKYDSKKLSMVVVYEQLQVENGEFGIKTIDQFRHFRMDEETGLCKITVYQRGNRNLRTFEVVEDITTDFDFMPVIEVAISDVPVMYDVAKINIRHMNMTSNLDRYITMAALPIPLVWGADIDEDGNPNATKPALVLGVDEAIFFHGPKNEADFEWRELSGDSVGLLEQHIENLEQDMLEAFERAMEQENKRSNQSATAAVINSKGSSATLTNIATVVEDGMKTALSNLAKMLGESFENSEILINKDFQPALDATAVPTLLQAYAQGAISWETFIQGMQNAELISVEDLDEEKQRIDEEMINQADNLLNE